MGVQYYDFGIYRTIISQFYNNENNPTYRYKKSNLVTTKYIKNTSKSKYKLIFM